MRPKKITPESQGLINVEAQRRAERLPPNMRMTNKQLAALTGLAELYVAQLVAKRRRQISIRVDVSCGTAASNVNSESSKAVANC